MNEIEKKLIALQEEREQRAKEKVWFAIQPAPKIKEFAVPVYNKKKVQTVKSVKIIEDLSPSQMVIVKHFAFISNVIEIEEVTYSANEYAFNIAVIEYQQKIRVLRNYNEKQIWDIIKSKFRREYNFLKTHYEKTKEREI